ncbi:hypothetical protein KFE25_007368 [Diacronema lutheri]|uniref:Fatty acid hydroxylase domain-containing protein n=1 Tax=Diacronema lutheri TaxID=2081491 RepID=A0A8J5Y099_DIALT|nr:hypothetical protein KFE25_007368 [Diacronema lutheri]
MLAWSWPQILAFSAAVFASYDVLDCVIARATAGASKLPMGNSKHLDHLDRLDRAFITFNRLTSIPFAYHCVSWVRTSESMRWELAELSPISALASLIAMFVAYDSAYCLWHRLLHMRGLYALVHKHHHRQTVPTRGLYDAINVHPVEFVVGEYLHLGVAMAIPAHAATYMAFFALLGVLTGLNHTRNDVHVPPLFSVRWHDMHHRMPQCNFGQYTVGIDWLCGSFKNA